MKITITVPGDDGSSPEIALDAGSPKRMALELGMPAAAEVTYPPTPIGLPVMFDAGAAPVSATEAAVAQTSGEGTVHEAGLPNFDGGAAPAGLRTSS